MRGKKVVTVLSVLLALIVIFLILFWALYGRRALSYECTNYAMGTYIQQTVYGKNREAAAAAAAKSIGELENLISWRMEDSDVAKLNAAAGADWTEIDPRTFSVLKTSLDVAQKSGGAFDPTILPVSSLWDFGGDNQHVPPEREIAEFLPYVDYKNLRVNEADSSASLKSHYMAIDLGGVGKGAACDAAVAAYRKSGADSAVVAAGGSIGVYGTKAAGTPWRIAVRDPKSSDRNTAMGRLDLREGFVSTSGTYEKQFTENGVTYHHLLNPKTGYPENNGLVSVTVKAKSGALSDALSTACFVLGREKGEALLKEYGAGGIFIDGSNKVYVTQDLKDSFEITDGRYTSA